MKFLIDIDKKVRLGDYLPCIVIVKGSIEHGRAAVMTVILCGYSNRDGRS